MAIISFWNKDARESGQTFSIAAIASYMALNNNMKILIISTQYNDSTLEDCYWNFKKNETSLNTLVNGKMTDISTGIEGLSKAVMSNKSTPEIITNYTKVVFKDRLEILCSPNTTDYKEYARIATSYKDIAQFANKYYDIVFFDLTKGFVDSAQSRELLMISDIVIYTFAQNAKAINRIMELKSNEQFAKMNNIMYLLSCSDAYSKYNPKNIARTINERKGILNVPYCTMFGEMANEGQADEYFIKYNKLMDMSDQNYIFIDYIKRDIEQLIYKLQELQMRY